MFLAGLDMALRRQLVDLALDRLRGIAAPRVLDLGTGSGAIALALQHERPAAQVWAVDRSPQALNVARRNGEALRLPVRWHTSDWLSGVPHDQRFDLIVSNPPYIATGELALRRAKDGHAFVTDGGHWILDAHLGRIPDPPRLADALSAIPGIVDHGLFIGIASTVVLASPNGIRIIERPAGRLIGESK